MQNSEIAASPVRFGYIGRRHPMPGEPNGHEEAHEGFKVFVANPGDVNDEGRVNRVYSRSVFHMGTGGPKRFDMRHHSAEIRLVHPEFGLKAFTQLMMNTGGTARCAIRACRRGQGRDRSSTPPCRLNGRATRSGDRRSRSGTRGREVYRSFATPAVFDPITVLNPANPTELVYIWDPRVAASAVPWRRLARQPRLRPRELRAAGLLVQRRRGATTYYTDAMGQPMASANPLALLQVISAAQQHRRAGHDRRPGRLQDPPQLLPAASSLGLKN